jgi:WD40 repeat protein/serine/threonine protein kinase/tetratricopeptide (TPR) repeat protein
MSDDNLSTADPLGQIADEFVEAFRQGKRPSVEEFARRYPEYADDLREMLPALVLMEKAKSEDGSLSPRGQAKGSGTPPGLRQLGDYEILREVGRGGMGVVYEAQQLSLGRHVAIKVLPAHALLDNRQLGRFQREARSAARLHHTNIVPVFGVGEQDGLHYYVMQFIPGLGLDLVLDELRRLRHPGEKQTTIQGDAPSATAATRDAAAADVARSLLSGQFRRAATAGDPTIAPGNASPATSAPTGSARTPARAADTSATIRLPGQSDGSTLSESGNQYWQSVARVGMQVADALAHAASQGIQHRDIKPSNLLLDDTGNVWVTDFGLAKATSDGDNLTHTGDIVGTLRYMAPERFNGRGDLRSDVYSLGLTLYELLTLRPAFDETDRNALIKQVMHDEPVRPRRINKNVPRDLETVVLKAIARDPGQRYQTPAEMADDLKRVIEDRPVQARRISDTERLWRWCRRNPVVTGLAAAVVLALAAGTTVSYLKYLDAEQQKEIAERQKGIAQMLQLRAEAGEKEAKEERTRADHEAEVTRQTLYYTYMHLAPQVWREPRGMTHLHDLLAHWVPAGEAPDRRGWEWFYLNSLPYQNLRILTAGGSQRASVVAWNVASNRLAEGTTDGLIRIWDIDREQTTLVLRLPEPVAMFWWGGGRWLDWSPDGSKLAAGGNDGTVHIWETSSGRQLHALKGHKSPVFAVAFASDSTRVAAWGKDGAIRLWDASTGRMTAELTHPGRVSAGAMSPNGTRLASGHEDGTVTISGTQAGDEIVTLRERAGAISNLAWSLDGTRLAATIRGDFSVKVWEAASGKVVLGPLRHSHEITSLAWEYGGQRLATGSADETIKLWDTSTGREIVTLRGHQLSITSLSWGKDGCLASGCGDGSVKIWNSVHDQEARLLPGPADDVTAVAWSPDGKRLASDGDDGVVRIWDPATRAEVRTFKGHDAMKVGQQSMVRSLAWSPDGTLLASPGLDGTTRVWQVASGKPVFSQSVNLGQVWKAVWSQDGTRLAVGSGSTIRVVEGFADTPKAHSFGASSHDLVCALAWSPQGDRLASGGWDTLVKLWDPKGVELARMEGHARRVTGVAWSPDGKQLASVSEDRLVVIWDTQTGRKLHTMRGHNDWVRTVVWSPDGTRLATAGLDNAVRVWDPRTGAEAFVLRGHAGMFHDVSWHPDGTQLAAASSDGHVWVWDATRGFERDTTSRALPYIDRKIASGAARGEDLLSYAESYVRAGKPTQALALVKDDLDSLRNLGWTLAEQGNATLAGETRARARALLEEQLAANPQQMGTATQLAELLLADLMALEATTWTVLKPIEVKSERGATLTPQDDGSILASGFNASGDLYTVSALADLDRVAAVRLEALPDPRLPSKGPGRHPSGNFQLSAFRLYHPAGDGEQMPRPLPVANARASFDYKAWDADIAGTIDASLRKVWHVWERTGQAHHAIFILRQPAAAGPRQPLVIALQHREYNPGINLGRFRLSACWNADILARERHLAAAMKLADPWARLAAAYHLLGDRPALDRLLKHHPAAAVAIGDLYTVDQDWERAIAEYSKPLTGRPADGDLLTKLATAYQGAGRTREAIPHLVAAASAADPIDTLLSFKVAAFQAWFGQDKELAATRQRLLAFAKDTDNSATAERAARICSLRPSADRAELGAALALGRAAVKLGPDGSGNLLALGMAEYRSGDDIAADRTLRAAAHASPNNRVATGIAQFYRAMSLFRQGQRAEALKLATEAAATMKPFPADRKNPLNPLDDSVSVDDLILWMAYKEALSMISLISPDEARPPEEKNDTK